MPEEKIVTREDINKQAFLLMTNITGVKIKTNIDDKHHETLMNSFIILLGMFNDFINEKELENKVTKSGKMFEFIKSKNPNLLKVFSIESKDYDDENGAAYDHYIVECQLAVADTSIPMDNLFGKKDATCLVNVEEYNRWVKNEEPIKWI